MALSRKAKESLKTALAMTVTYGIALQMEWDQPHWAAFAVAFVSLANVGQSLNKAALRMTGTVAAMVVAMIFIAVSAQNRWLFITLVSVWLALCTYRMTGAKQQYFWNICGFVTVVICMTAGPDSANAFHIAIIRFLQTGLGILVYSLVCIFIWPVSSGPQFREAAVSWASKQRDMLAKCLAEFRGKCDPEAVSSAATAEQRARAAFAGLLAAAETDDYEVWECRLQWREFNALATRLTSILEHWRDCLTDLKSATADRLLPGLAGFTNELDSRMAGIESLLEGHAAGHRPGSAEIAPVREQVLQLSQFERAALALAGARLQELETITRALFECVSGLKGYGEEYPVSRDSRDVADFLILDPDRMLSAFRVVVIVWLAFLAYVFVDGLPAGTVVVSMAASFGMILSSMPQLRVSKLIVPVAFGALVGSIAYIFVMPHLSRFYELGILIFGTTFALCYLFAAPQQMLGRAFGLALFLVIAGISNEQNYSFLAVANTVLVFPAVFLVLEISAYVPFSPRPEKTIERLLGRFFESCRYLAENVGRTGTSSGVARWRLEYHARQVRTVPAKLAAWAKFVRPEVVDTTPAAIQGLIATVRSLSRRMTDLQQECSRPQPTLILDQIREDARAWETGVSQGLRRLAYDPASESDGDLRAGLDELLEHLESRIMDIINSVNSGEIDESEAVNFYRLLGAYRSFSEALVDYTARSAMIDRTRWREERFG